MKTECSKQEVPVSNTLPSCAFWKLNKEEKTSYFTFIKERNTGQQLRFTTNICKFVNLMAKPNRPILILTEHYHDDKSSILLWNILLA